MGKTILFSPVGGTDPIANNHDGSLLHICRVYHPDTVYMFLSSEILAHHRKDNRYCYCLDRLQEKDNFKMTYEIIEQEDLKNVQEYNYFFKTFYKHLMDIQADMSEGDVLLLNIASGTPAMKGALLVIQQIMDVPAKCIQTTTPVRKRNVHKDINEYDVVKEWELDEDNMAGFEIRCEEVQCPSLVNMKNLEIIKKQIAAFDYQAALSVAELLPGRQYSKLKKLLKFAKARQDLNTSAFKKELKEEFIPIRETEDKMNLFEYALNLDNKLKRKEYSEYIRAITPLLVDLYEQVLRDSCGIDIGELTFRDHHNSLKWSMKNLNGTEAKAILDAVYSDKGGFKGYFVQSDHLEALIHEKAGDDQLKEDARCLREVEIKIRNIAAHEIVSITDRNVKDLTGLSGNEIMDKIRSLFSYTSLNSGSLDWSSYQKMNEYIIEEARTAAAGL